MGRLDGRVAIITGAARGQGEAEARLFVQEGAKVVVTDVLEEEGRAVAADLGDSAVFVPNDVTSEDDWQHAVAQTLDRFGAVDVLVNNAGILHVAPLLQTSTQDFQRVVDVNQTGVFVGMRTVAPAMGEGASIVNVSSIDGIVGTPGLCAYVATKFAVRGMTRVAAMELAPLGIRVNSIHPGAIATPMLDDPAPAAVGMLELVKAKIPMNRVAAPSEVATLAAYLASNESSYCTGSEFVVDGGMLAGTYFPAS
jgi:3alpha(or 20beta)-hydroxysteroid dehydrogenase